MVMGIPGGPTKTGWTPRQRYEQGLMTPQEKYEYELAQSTQQVEEDAQFGQSLENLAIVEAEERAKAAAFKRQASIPPDEQAFFNFYGSWREGYTPPPSALAEAPAAPPTDPLGDVPTKLTYDDEEDKPGPSVGRDYAADIRGLQTKFSGKLTAAEDRWTGRQEDIKKEYRTDEDARVTQAETNLEKAQNVLTTATTKLSNWEINPQRAFPNAFSKIAAVISVAMGAYAQGLSGGKIPNTALEIINGAIKNDIDAQKMEYQKLKGLVDEKRNVYGMAMRLLGSAEQAEAVAYSAAFQTFQGEINKVGKDYGLAFGAINLSSEIDFRNRKLALLAAKAEGAGSGLKMSNQARAAMAGAGAVQDKARAVGASSKELGEAIPIATWFMSKMPYFPTDAKEFDRNSEQLVLTIINALSGKTMSEYEHKKFEKWTPRAGQTIGERASRLRSLLSTMSHRSASWMRLESPEVREMVKRASPDLAPLMEGSSQEREAAVNAYVAELMGTSLSAPASNFADLGGETVSKTDLAQRYYK
tara:strand:+ start:214 stop:1803 length:1590 start_codon:yes stop_codon:yes gene_type:complete